MHKNSKIWVLKLIVTSSLSGIFQPKIIKLNITVEVPLSSNNFCKIICKAPDFCMTESGKLS